MKNKKMELPKILWINLERSVERFKKIKYELDLFNLNHTRIDAIDGSKYELNNLKIENKDFKIKQIACASSHLKAIKYFVDNHEDIGDYCLIMEDDVDIAGSIKMWNKSFNEYISIYNDIDWDVIQMQVLLRDKKINKISQKNKFENNFRLNIPYKRDDIYFGTGIYLINIRYAKELVNIYKINKENFIDNYNNIEFFYKMNSLKKVHVDHYLIYNNKTYILPLFFINDNNESFIESNLDYKNFQNRVNNNLKKYMINIL